MRAKARTHAEVKAELLQDPETRKAYEDLEIAEQIIRMRVLAGLTQEQLAERTGMKQPSIARLEAGRIKPGLETIHRIAAACGCYVNIVIEKPDMVATWPGTVKIQVPSEACSA